MGIDIGGNQITQASSVLTINTGASMRMLSAGGVSRPQHPQFIAIGTGTDWVYITPDGQWNKMPFANVTVNVGSCYSGALSRFTAPVAGSYFFQASVYLLKDGANAGYYWHPLFYVNGLPGGGTVNTASANYRLRGYGQNTATYSDSDIRQVYQLAAGDYVEHYLYSTGAGGNRYYGPQSRFTGFLLG
jgi:C1q domain